VRRLLADECEVEDVPTHEEALELVRDVGDFDVAIVDVRPLLNGSGELGGQETIRALNKAEPSLGIVAHGGQPERHLATAALQAGASAYVTGRADTEHLRTAVKAALDNRTFLDPAVPPRGSRGKLTRRQRQILQLLADGGSTTVAASDLDLSEETVKTHTKNILARLGARNRVHAVAIALRESLIE
jgi:two-component system NarL family response regulator